MGRRRSAMLLLLAAVTFTASAASAAELHQELGLLAQMKPVLSMPAVFSIERDGESFEIGEGGMVVAEPAAFDVLVARLDRNGDVVTACVNTEEAAQNFLQKPVGKLTPARAAGE